jgi:hypothetical protein
MYGLTADGKAKVQSLSDVPLSLRGQWETLDKESVIFAATLTVLSPLAHHVFTNIEYANIGRKFQATAEGLSVFSPFTAMEEKASTTALTTSERFSLALERVGNMVYDGTIQESLHEPMIDIVFLNFLPIPASYREIAEEIITPEGGIGNHYRNIHSFELSAGRYRIADISPTADVSTLTASEQAHISGAGSQLVGRTTGEFTADDWRVLSSLPIGTVITVAEGNVQRHV